MGGHGRGPRRRRTGLRVALVTTMAVAAVALLAGLGMAATPQLVPAAMDPAAHSLLAAADGDLVEALRDKDVPDACRPPTRACVDLDNAKAWLLDANGVTRGPVEIRAGDDQTPTPRGQFTVQWKAKTYTSREYLRQMPWSVFFADGGIAFHQGTFDAASGGCVKLSEDDARAFFDYLQVGDRVQVV